MSRRAKNETAGRFTGPQSGLDWRVVLDSFEDGVLVLDEKGDVEYMNDAAEKLLATSRHAAIGRSFRDATGQQAINAMIATSRDQGMSLADQSAMLEFPPDRPGVRNRIPVTVKVTPLNDDEGRRRGTTVTVIDRTRTVELERDLVRSDRLASMGTIAAGLAHEIKNPLGGIGGAGQLLLREPTLSETGREAAQIIRREVERVNGLIERLLRFAKHQPLETEELNIHQLIDETIALVKMARPGQEFVREYDPSLPPVAGNPGQLKQVFLNLIQNAVQASPDGRNVIVGTRLVNKFRMREPQQPARHYRRLIEVSVTDRGAGIPPENFGRLFTPFFTTKPEGTGLGLATAHQIVREHDGFLTVTSQPGDGTTFFVHLPEAGAASGAGTNNGQTGPVKQKGP